MKEITYGESNNNIGDKIEALVSTDVLSARTLNRPFLNAYEELEITNKLTSKLFGAVYSGNGVAIIPGLYEELKEVTIEQSLFDLTTKFIRLPLGGYINSDGEYIINRPNCELFERELANAFQINLNDLENNIRCTFEINNATIIYTLTYKIYTGIGYKEGTITGTNVFELVNSFYNEMGGISIIVSKTSNFHLEDFIPYTSSMPYIYAYKEGVYEEVKYSQNKKFIYSETEIPELINDLIWSPDTDKYINHKAVFESDKYPKVTTLTATGDIFANSFNATSAREKKTDIVPTSYNALDEINKIDIVDFYFKTDTNKEHKKIGFIADDTDPIFSVDNKHFDVGNSIGMLLKAVQELSAENKKLKEKIENL